MGDEHGVHKRAKGQRSIAWDDAENEWEEYPQLGLRTCHHYFGGDGMKDEVTLSIVQYRAGSEVPVHSHNVDYCSVVVQGSIEVTRRNYLVGSIRFVRANTAYGPLKAGPEGCTVIDIFACGNRTNPIETHFIERAPT